MMTKQELATLMEDDLGRSFDPRLIEQQPDPFVGGVHAVRYGPLLSLRVDQPRLIAGLPVEPIVIEGFNDDGLYEFYLVTPDGVEQVVFTSWPPMVKF